MDGSGCGGIISAGFGSGGWAGSGMAASYFRRKQPGDYPGIFTGGINQMEIINKGFMEVTPFESTSKRQLYEHQKAAMRALDQMDQEDEFSTLLVMPTGSGKTSTATTWLLRNAVDQGKKVLWIAHRQMLLDQAAESFAENAYKERVPNISKFSIRVISGSPDHDRMMDIKASDNVLIISKDSIARDPKALAKWLKNEDGLYFIIDEAHHSTAKSYRTVIDYVQSKVKHVKLIGLTATPIRTAEKEQGLLAKIYKDGTADGSPDSPIVHGITGIAYKTDLDTLIKKQILSRPVFDHCETGFDYGDDLGIRDWQRIEQFDQLPDDIAEKMAISAARNNLIVQTYVKNRSKYGQTIVFALNVDHAIQLTAVFQKHGVKAGRECQALLRK
jgi:ATP-dependent helicase IRC3